MARPVSDHYVPDLLHLRQELEDAATPEGHALRFGFNPLEFESFSWRGYAHMTAIQVGRRPFWRVAEEQSQPCAHMAGRPGSPSAQDTGWQWPGR